MWRKSKQQEPETDFKADIPEYPDEEIIEILRKRKYYQAEAVELATEEALKRELIHSEQDLFDEEFHAETLKFGLFPSIEDEKNKRKIRKSLARGILISGILPTVWGFLKINEGNNLEGTLLLTGGVLWIMFAARLIQALNIKLVNALFVLTGFSIIYVVKFLLLENSFVFMDFFIVTLLYGLLVYGLVFLHKLK